MEPASYKRRVLLCATGLSPQVVTETVYALATQREPAFIPTEVHVISTIEGAERARLTLLHHDGNQFGKLCKAYGLPPISFAENNIHVIRNSAGEPLVDIHDAEANSACADTMIRLVGEITSDPESALHVSIAGGRKTMGYLLGYALTLLGRRQDRMSHVLVSSPYESQKDFFFPTPTSQVLYTRDGKPLDASKAQVQLAEIPYVNLRSGMVDLIAGGGESFSDVVRKANSVFGNLPVHVDVASRCIRQGDMDIELSPQNFMVWLWFARRARAGKPAVGRSAFHVEDDLKKDFRATLMAEPELRFDDKNKLDEMWQHIGTAAQHPIQEDGSSWLSLRITGINKSIRATLGEAGVRQLGISSKRKGQTALYQSALDPQRIEFS